MDKNLFPVRYWNKKIRRVLSVLNGMRIALLLSLLVFFISIHYLQVLPNNTVWMAAAKIKLLYVWWVIYAFVALFSFIYPDWQRPNQGHLPSVNTALDISMITWLVYLMGGSGTGLGIVVLPFLAITCLLGYGQYSLLYAAYAALLVGFEIFLKYVWQGDSFLAEDTLLLFNQMVLIASFFVVSLLTSFSAQYVGQASISMHESQKAYDHIANLNKIVMNRMQEAAVVVDKTRHIWLFNRKALQYFPFLRVGANAGFLHPLLVRWQSNVRHSFEITCDINGKAMYIRAIPLVQEQAQFLTLFFRLESERVSEAQTVKLTSLGQLTANLAHEIRNPLSAMRQASGLLLEAEEGNAMAEKLCRIIENNIIRIDKMIEDVSVLNKQDRIQEELIDLAKFLDNFSQEFLLATPDSSGCLKILLPISFHPMVFFDAFHLSQIMWNLCNNGWRYCSKSRGSLVINVSKMGDRNISLRVWDDGAGVPAEHLSKLFDPFFTTQKQSDGTGLGLYVARELAHANKGDLRYLEKEKVFELILRRAQHDKES